MTTERPPRTIAEVEQLLAAHKRHRQPKAKRREPQPANGWDRLRARLHRWETENAPLHRLVCDPRLSDGYCHPADLDELITAWQARGIRFRRYRRTMLAAERRGDPIDDLDAELIRRFTQRILTRID